MIGTVGSPFRVPTIDKDRRASGALAGLHIAPSIANHEAVGQTQTGVAGGIFEHARVRLSARAPVAIVMIANAELVDRKGQRQLRVHRVNHVTPLCASGDIGLISDNHETKSGITQSNERIAYPGQDFEVLHAHRWVRSSVANERAIDHPVTIKENGPTTLVHLPILY